MPIDSKDVCLSGNTELPRGVHVERY